VRIGIQDQVSPGSPLLIFSQISFQLAADEVSIRLPLKADLLSSVRLIRQESNMWSDCSESQENSAMVLICVQWTWFSSPAEVKLALASPEAGK
jgi:hypothetical protein